LNAAVQEESIAGEMQRKIIEDDRENVRKGAHGGRNKNEEEEVKSGSGKMD
jgi:hypothetical protein